MEHYPKARYCEATQAIVRKATAWVALQVRKRSDLFNTPMADWPVDRALFLATEAAHKALDDAALSGDEATTTTAARAYCEAWQRVLKSATEKE